MTESLKTGSNQQLFKDEYAKLKFRQVTFRSIQSDKDKDLNFDSMLTYGNVLLDFCYYRVKLRDFHAKSKKISSINAYLKVSLEVI